MPTKKKAPAAQAGAQPNNAPAAQANANPGANNMSNTQAPQAPILATMTAEQVVALVDASVQKALTSDAAQAALAGVVATAVTTPAVGSALHANLKVAAKEQQEWYESKLVKMGLAAAAVGTGGFVLYQVVQQTKMLTSQVQNQGQVLGAMGLGSSEEGQVTASNLKLLN